MLLTFEFQLFLDLSTLLINFQFNIKIFIHDEAPWCSSLYRTTHSAQCDVEKFFVSKENWSVTSNESEEDGTLGIVFHIKLVENLLEYFWSLSKIEFLSWFMI